MRFVDCMIYPQWVVPVCPAGAVFEQHAVVVDQGRIVAVGPRAQMAEQYQAALTIDKPGHVLMPGLVNTHTHAAMSLFRGLADDLPLMTWLNDHMWPAEAQFVSPDMVQDGTELAIAEMIRGGVTTMQDMYFFPDVAARVAVKAGFRAVVGMIVIEFPSAWARDVDEYFRKGLAVHDEFRNEPLVSTALAPHAPYTVDDAALGRLRMLADELDLHIHMHVHETADEVTQSEKRFGMRPLRRLEQLGLLTPALMAVHMTQLEEDEIELCAASGLRVIHCPHSNLKLASGMAPVAALISAGVEVALGTDGAASNNSLDLFAEMRTAALLGKAVAGDATALRAEQALAMATINGARTLGLEAEIGSIEPGKSADLTLVDLRPLATQPVHQVVSQLVYAVDRRQVTDVWIAGNPVLRDGQLTSIDIQSLSERVDQWGQRIARADARRVRQAQEAPAT